MRNAITVNAPAKLNLTLEVVERRPNGYHNIRSIMVRLRTLVDVLRIEVTSGRTEIRIATNSPHIPAGHGNICHEAARSFLENAGESARIDLHIDKQIPVAAGLGGGSSDAAAVLLGLNRIFN